MWCSPPSPSISFQLPLFNILKIAVVVVDVNVAMCILSDCLACLGEECDQLNIFLLMNAWIYTFGWMDMKESLCSGGGVQLQACMYVLPSFFHHQHTHTHTSRRRPSINDSHVKPVWAPWGSHSLMLPSIIMLTVISSSSFYLLFSLFLSLPGLKEP